MTGKTSSSRIQRTVQAPQTTILLRSPPLLPPPLLLQLLPYHHYYDEYIFTTPPSLLPLLPLLSIIPILLLTLPSLLLKLRYDNLAGTTHFREPSLSGLSRRAGVLARKPRSIAVLAPTKFRRLALHPPTSTRPSGAAAIVQN